MIQYKISIKVSIYHRGSRVISCSQGHHMERTFSYTCLYQINKYKRISYI